MNKKSKIPVSKLEEKSTETKKVLTELSAMVDDFVSASKIGDDEKLQDLAINLIDKSTKLDSLIFHLSRFVQ